MQKNGKPYTNENGYTDSKLLSDMPEDVQGVVLLWIANNIYPRKTPLRGITSYWLKHRLQHDTGVYVTDDVFRNAMMLSGYHPVTQNAASWKYCISRRSPVFDR